LIHNYKLNSSFSGTVYADPSRELFKALGMTIESLKRTPGGEKPKSYVGGLIAVTLKSIIGIRNPMHIGKQGNFSQLGGEFIIGPGRTCSFAHRMMHTQDHIEVCDLLEKAEVLSINKKIAGKLTGQ